MKKHRLLQVLSLMLATAFSSSVNAEIKIGAAFALTGGIAGLAADMKSGAALAMKHVNEQGGVLDQKYQLIYEDSGCNPDKAVDVVTKLIEEDKVSAIVGPVCSGATLRQARSVSIPAGVVSLSVASSSMIISRLRDNDLVFRTVISDALKGEKMAEFAINNGIKDIAVSSANDAYSTGSAKAFSEAYKAKGGRILVSQVHQADRPDYKREMSALLARSKNIALFAYYRSGVQVLKDAFSLGETNWILATDSMLAQELIDELGAEALKSTRIFNNTSDDRRVAFETWSGYAKQAGIPPKGPAVASSYDAAFMMALAIEAMGSADRADISKGLRAISGPEGEVILPGEFRKAKRILKDGGSINYDGGSGAVDFDENGDVSGFVGVSHVEDGQWKSEIIRQ